MGLLSAGVERRSWNWGSDLGLREPEVAGLDCESGVPQFPVAQPSQGLQQGVGQQLLEMGATVYHGV